MSLTHIDEGSPAFQFFCGVAINDIQFGACLNPTIYTLDKIFIDPLCLRDVSFTDWANVGFVRDIVTHCHALQMMEMTMSCKLIVVKDFDRKAILPGIDITSKTPPEKCLLRSVECLKLVPGIQPDENLRSHVVMSLLRGTRSGPYLKKVIFQCELDNTITLCQVLRITCEVMEFHPNLEALFLALLNDEYLLPEAEAMAYSHYMDLSSKHDATPADNKPETVEYFHERIVAAGKTLKIKKMGLAMLNNSMQLIWGDFLKTQSNLVHLSLTVNIREGTFSKEIFDTCSSTLEQLAIRGKFENPFDFYHVSACHNLKEICLHNLQDNGGGGIAPKCINLPQVPHKLEGLILFQVVTRTEELQQALQKLDCLSTLVVFKCGHAAGETGVGLDCLTDILHKRSLNSTLMVQFICGSTSEAEALAGVLYELSQDVENIDGPINRIRRRLRQHPELEVHEDPAVLHLPDNVQGGNGNDVLFAIQGEGQLAPAQQQRPVSRGNHRDDNIPTGLLSVEEYPPLPEVQPSTPEAPPAPQENPLNVLHNILEHVLVENGENNGNQGVVNFDLDQLNNNLHFDNVHLNELDDDVELIFDVGEQDINGPMLDLFAAERLAREHNVQVGFILDGVIDIINEEVVRSKWLCTEDSSGGITYTLKISVEL